MRPSAASALITRTTSCSSSGSSAEVGSSNKSARGSMHSARAIAARCCWPPESWAGKASHLSPIPTLSRYSARLLQLRPVAAQNRERRFHHVLQDRHMRPEIELLEHHRKVGPDPGDLCVDRRDGDGALALPAHRLALEYHIAGLAVFQKVRATKQGGFARARRADQRDHVALFGNDINALQNLQRAEAFVQVADFNHGRGAGHEGQPFLISPQAGSRTQSRQNCNGFQPATPGQAAGPGGSGIGTARYSVSGILTRPRNISVLRCSGESASIAL